MTRLLLSNITPNKVNRLHYTHSQEVGTLPYPRRSITPHHMRLGGFTLIEILIALSIFAIIATLTASVVGRSFNIRERITQHADRNNQIWTALIILQREVQQIVLRNIRTKDMQLVPTFIGKADYFEFTRGGFVNPGGQEKRSELKRIAYLCRPPHLLRRTWSTLDPVDANQFQEKILLRNIEDCHFAYLNQHLQVLSEWQTNLSQTTNNPIFPKAIQFNISAGGKNNISGLAIVPSALYADI